MLPKVKRYQNPIPSARLFVLSGEAVASELELAAVQGTRIPGNHGLRGLWVSNHQIFALSRVDHVSRLFCSRPHFELCQAVDLPDHGQIHLKGRLDFPEDCNEGIFLCQLRIEPRLQFLTHLEQVAHQGG